MIEELYKTAMNNFNEYVDMIYIQALSYSNNETDKKITDELIENFLKKRGYTMNYILNKRVMIKDFTCVYFDKGLVEIWTDKANNNKSVFIKDSLITGLPLILNYFERI